MTRPRRAVSADPRSSPATPDSLAELLAREEAAAALEALMSDDAPTDARVSGDLVERVPPEGGIGLALAGPFADGSTRISLRGPNGIHLNKRGRNFQDTDHIRRWIVIQGLDKIRRVLLGEMESPVDWN